MGTRFRAEEPEKHVYSLTMDMPLSDWIALKEQLCAGRHYAAYPGSKFVSEIESMVSQAKCIYWPNKTEV